MDSTSLAVMTASRLHVAEKGDFGLDLRGEELLGPADQDVRLDADLPQLHDAVLGRLGLQLVGGLDERDQGDVDVDGVLAPEIRLELANGLQEGQGFDVAHRPADFDDGHVGIVGDAPGYSS